MTTALAEPQLTAAEHMRIARMFLDKVGALVVRETARAGDTAIYRPGYFAPDWVADLPLAIGEARAETQRVALARDISAGVGTFERFGTVTDTAAAQLDERRTQIYESLNVGTPGYWWFKTIVEQFERLTRVHCDLSAYVSSTSDRTLGRHWDLLHGLLVHFRGLKVCQVWQPDGSIRQIVLRPGDLLWIPRGVNHNMWTPGPDDHEYPGSPGYSVHYQFGILTDEPFE